MKLTTDEKRQIIEQVLTKHFGDPNIVLGQPELKTFLDSRMTGNTFNPHILSELTGYLQSQSKSVTPLNFAGSVVAAEDKLLEKQTQLQSELSRLQAEADQYHQKEIEFKTTEILNNNQISNQARLNILMKSAENIMQKGQPGSALFELEYEGQKEQFGPSNNPNVYIINKTVEFPVTNPNTSLTLRVIDPLSNNPVAAIPLELSKFKDQKQHLETIQMASPQTGNIAKIKMQVQYIHSMVQLYNSLYNETNDVSNKAREDLSTASEYLTNLVAPFPELTQKKLEAPLSAGSPSFSIAGPGMALGGALVSQGLPSFFPQMNYAYLITSLLGGLLHSTFLDTIIAGILIGSVNIGFPLMSKTLSLILIMGCVLAIIWGAIWLWFYSKNWWSSGYTDNFLNQGYRRISVVIEYLLMLFRGGVAGLLLSGRSRFSDQHPLVGFNANPMMPGVNPQITPMGPGPINTGQLGVNSGFGGGFQYPVSGVSMNVGGYGGSGFQYGGTNTFPSQTVSV